jgi:hypothetical protein
MQAEMLADLRGIMRCEHRAVTGEHVTDAPVVTPKTARVTPVTPVTPNFDEGRNANSEGEAAADRTRLDDDKTAIEERKGLAADRVPAMYLDVWARLNHQRPFDVSEPEWRLALDDGGRFLDAWGEDAAALDIPAYAPDALPAELAALPAVKPGSRALAGAA